VGTDTFFVDPAGNVLPCNGSDAPMIMGNLHEQSFEEIWHGQRAGEIRNQVKNCAKHCWMIGSAAPAMKKNITIPAAWIIRNKLKMKKHRGAVCLDRV
jgi:sulfatase maturation enzyme AslB (radical SAM superfamily)